MGKSMIRVAEDLASEFADLPQTTVVRVLTDCLSAFPTSNEYFVEQATRARLRQERRRGAAHHAGSRQAG